MNSQSIASVSDLDGFPISGSPINGDVLAYNNGQFEYVTLGDTDIEAVQNVGDGAQIFKETVASIAKLRSLKGSTNIDTAQSVDTCSVSLKSTISNIDRINLSGGGYIKMAAGDYYMDIMLPNGVDKNMRIGSGDQSIMSIDGLTAEWYWSLNDLASPLSLCCLNNNGKLMATSPYNIQSVGTGTSFIKNRVNNTWNLYSLKSDANINILPGTDDLTLQLNTSINPTVLSNANLSVNASTLALPNLSTGTEVYTLALNASNQVIKSTAGIPYTFSNIGSGLGLYKQILSNNVEFKSILTDGNLAASSQPNTITISMNNAISPSSLNATNLQINSIIQATNVAVDTPIYTLGLLNTGQVIKYVPSVSPSTNIYNSDGQFTTVDRVITGLTPGSVNNRLVLQGCNLSFANNISYNYSNTSLAGRDNMILSFDSVSSRGIIAPYNKNSQKGQITLSGSAGYTVDFYRSDLVNLGSQNWQFDVELYEANTTATLESFSGKWTFQVNKSYLESIALNTRLLIKPLSCSGNNPASAFFKNLVNLSIYRPASSFGAIVLSFESAIGGGSSQFFKWAVKDFSANDKIVTILNTASLITNTQNYYKPTYAPSFYFSGIGAPPTLSWEYFGFGKDVCIDVRSHWISINNVRSADISVLLNGNIVMTIPVKCGNGQKDGYYMFSQKRILNYQNLINTGVLLLNGLNNITHTITGTNPADFSFTGCPYSVDISFV